ncbi:MAG: hypothetical protein AABX12_01880 [Nanoarchaeota archaeon]
MGKNSALKTLGKIIGNVVLHKMLARYTNKPESMSHLLYEESEYRASAIKSAKEFNWNEEDKQDIKRVAIEFFKNKSIKKYPDVAFQLEEAESLVSQELEEMNL